MNNELLELINERDKTLTLSNKNKGNTLLREKFNMLRNKVQREVKKVKSSYFHNKIEENENNPKKLWKQFKALGYSNKTKNSKIVLDINNEICFEPKTVAQYMNEFFLNVASSLVNKLPVLPNIFTTNSDLIKSFYAEKKCNS